MPIIPPYGPGYDPPGPQLEGWQVARVAANAGFDDTLLAGYSVSNLVMAVAISQRESGWVVNIPNSGGAPAWGLWQIFLPAHPDVSQQCAIDAWCAAQKAWEISSQGTNFFGPWAPPPAQNFIDAAVAAVAQMRSITEQPPQNDAASVTVADFKNAGTPAGRTRFWRLTIPAKGQPFTLTSYNGAKLVGHGTGPVTQASVGLVLGVEANPNGLGIVVTADDGGTFNYTFEA